MNRKPAFLITGFLSMLLLLNCKKEKAGNNPPDQNLFGIKVKILEYGSEIPLANVKLTASKCLESGKYGCISSEIIKSWTSGIDGIINISKTDIPASDVIFSAFEPDHWINTEDPIFENVIKKLKYDSAIIRLYPFATISFHFKNLNNYGAKEWIRAYMEALPDNKMAFSIESPFLETHVANNVDTIITYKTYGNVKNRLVCELFDSNYVFIKKVIDESKFIQKSAIQEWNVNY